MTASQPNGFYYGIQTIYQLLPPAIYGKELIKQQDWSLPAVEIEDAPCFPYRGLMLDVCRHFSSIDYIYKFIDIEETATISAVTFGTLYNPAFRILPASAVNVEVSSDGKEYRSIAQASYTREYPEKGRKAFTDTVKFNPTETRYVKVILKSGGTLKNGIVCRKDSPDEIILSGYVRR